MIPQLRVSTISRNAEEYSRESTQDIQKVFRNAQPHLHPFDRAREYVRALNATKLEKVFAKPFLFSLDGHLDGVYCINTFPTSLIHVFSGAGDGEVRVWDLSAKKCLWNVKAHTNLVKGVVSDHSGEMILSCSTDATIKMWKKQQDIDDIIRANITPVETFIGTNTFNAIDHHRTEGTFATSGVRVDLWSHERADPIHSFEWGADSVNTVKFSPVEQHILVSTATDRNIVLYDIRQKSPLKKIIMNMQTNAVCFNPMEAFYFSTANEDHNAYTFDMRKLDHAVTIHEDHVSAVMSIDYAPTGKELVTGSYDRTIRIFGQDAGHSREVYHTKRMQRIFSVKYSSDNKYILSGSDDTNIRLWKARAAEKLNQLMPRERAAVEYRQALKQRFSHTPEVRRIARDRPVPKSISKAKLLKHEMTQSAKRKEERRRQHSKPGAVPYQNAKKAVVRKEVE